LVEDTGHSLKWSIPSDAGSTVLYADMVYTALQFHIHTGSEHTVQGVRPDIEFHFVHQNADGGYGVLGIMCNAGESDLEFWSQIDESLTSEVEIDANSLFNSVNLEKYYTYDGSFTTPPCTEEVKWTVIADMCTIPTALLRKFTAYSSMDGNYRHIQPLNDRVIGGVGTYVPPVEVPAPKPKVTMSMNMAGVTAENWVSVQPPVKAALVEKFSVPEEDIHLYLESPATPSQRRRLQQDAVIGAEIETEDETAAQSLAQTVSDTPDDQLQNAVNEELTGAGVSGVELTSVSEPETVTYQALTTSLFSRNDENYVLYDGKYVCAKTWSEQTADALCLLFHPNEESHFTRYQISTLSSGEFSLKNLICTNGQIETCHAESNLVTADENSRVVQLNCLSESISEDDSSDNKAWQYLVPIMAVVSCCMIWFMCALLREQQIQHITDKREAAILDSSLLDVVELEVPGTPQGADKIEMAEPAGSPAFKPSTGEAPLRKSSRRRTQSKSRHKWSYGRRRSTNRSVHDEFDEPTLNI